MADDLFSPPPSRAASPDPASSSSAAPSLPISTAPATAAGAFVPRAVKRKPTAPPSAPSDAAKKQTQKVDHKKRERLEGILQAVEGCLSDWGLSMYGRGESGLLLLLKRGNGSVHVSSILALNPVRALTSTMPDVQNALRLRDSPLIAIDAVGFRISRRVQPDYEKLQQMQLAEWDDAVIYLENIPLLPSADPSLPILLSSLLPSYPQKLVLPPLFDKDNPPSLAAEEGDAAEDRGISQSELFAQSQREKEGGVVEKKPRALPKGGGPFKGYAFVVLAGKGEVERVLEQWRWETDDGEAVAREVSPEAQSGGAQDEEDELMQDGENGQAGKGKGKEKVRTTPLERAKRSGMRALSYSGWLDLKREYLAYHRNLTTLLEAQGSGELDRIRNPPKRDQPPHLAQQKQQRGNKRAASPSATAHSGGDNSKHPHHPSSDGHAHPPPPAKKPKSTPNPAPDELLSFSRRISKLRTPPPALDRDSSAALSVQGAYPEGCVLWLRNVHEKSTKTSLKALSGALLEQLQEGSGKGVEFVDYEKGAGMCYLRLSSSSLSYILLDHLESTPSLHLAQSSLSPVSSLSPSALQAAETDLRRPLIPSLLAGEQERRYWAAVPEPLRRKARENAQGRVGLVQQPKRAKGQNGEEEDVKPFLSEEEEDVKPFVKEEEEKKPKAKAGKRKRPNKS
ncbi:hypothetical protein JCM11641_003866 [Rhodosporidiobolus odoratus]